MSNDKEYEETSYKYMWLTLRKTLENWIRDSEIDSVLKVKCHDYAMECLAKAHGFDKVLERMDEMEEEIKK